MSCDAQIMVNDIGTIFQITVKDEDCGIVDLSTASTKQIIFRKPDGTLLTKSASFVNSGDDGKIKWVSVSGDLDLPGMYRVQAYIVIGSTQFRTNVGEFKVFNNI
jgi:hypothetical protein